MILTIIGGIVIFILIFLESNSYSAPNNFWYILGVIIIVVGLFGNFSGYKKTEIEEVKLDSFYQIEGKDVYVISTEDNKYVITYTSEKDGKEVQCTKVINYVELKEDTNIEEPVLLKTIKKVKKEHGHLVFYQKRPKKQFMYQQVQFGGKINIAGVFSCYIHFLTNYITQLIINIIQFIF